MKKLVCVMLCVLLSFGFADSLAARPSEIIGTWYASSLTSTLGEFVPLGEYRLELNRDKSAAFSFAGNEYKTVWTLSSNGEAYILYYGEYLPIELKDGIFTLDDLRDDSDPFGTKYSVVFDRERKTVAFPTELEAKSEESLYGTYEAYIVKQGEKIANTEDMGIRLSLGFAEAEITYGGETLLLVTDWFDGAVILDLSEASGTYASYALGGYTHICITDSNEENVILAIAYEPDSSKVGPEIALKKTSDETPKAGSLPKARPAVNEEELFGTYKVEYVVYSNGTIHDYTDDYTDDEYLVLSYAEAVTYQGEDRQNGEVFITDYIDNAIVFSGDHYKNIVRPTDEDGVLVVEHLGGINDTGYAPESYLIYIRKLPEKTGFTIPDIRYADSPSDFDGEYVMLAIVSDGLVCAYEQDLSVVISDLNVELFSGGESDGAFEASFEGGEIVLTMDDEKYTVNISSNPDILYLTIDYSGDFKYVCLMKRSGAEISGFDMPTYERELKPKDGAKTPLDLIFESDNAVLTVADASEYGYGEFTRIDEAAWSAVAEYYMGYDASSDEFYSGLDAALSENPAYVVSISPAGNSGFAKFGSDPICFYDGKYSIMYPSIDKGVEDLYGNLHMLFLRYIKGFFAISTEGITYSHDGRYAVISDFVSYISGQYTYDPIIIDLATGEMILINTFSRYPNRDNIGALGSACFSADDRYLYYTIYSGISRLYRYDMQSGQTELCFTSPYLGNAYDFLYTPRLILDAEGDLLIFSQDRSMEDSAIIKISETQNGWFMNKTSLGFIPHTLTTHYICYSEKSHLAFTVYRGYSQILLNCFDTSGSPNGLTDFYAICRDDFSLKRLSPEEASQLTEDELKEFVNLRAYAISPDGEYALAVTSIDRIPRFLLIRLSDLNVRELKLNSDEMLSKASSILTASYMRLEWNSDNMIIFSPTTADPSWICPLKLDFE